MKRTTIKLSDDLDVRMRNEAERRQITIAELNREALETYLGGGRRRFLAAGAGDSGREDISGRIEEILQAEMGSQP